MTNQRVDISYEIFPPKTPQGKVAIVQELEKLCNHNPAFISVTCGAGGSDNTNNLELCKIISQTLQTPCIAHLTCIGMNRQQALARLQTYQDTGIQSILALRGDIPDQNANNTDIELPHAIDLLRIIRQYFSCKHLYVAGYPEGHYQNPNKQSDLIYQLQKAQHADGIITQLFFNNSHFNSYYKAMRKSGYKGEIIAGILPITNVAQVIKISKLCNAEIPKSLHQSIIRYQNDPASLLSCGIDYAAKQILELRERGQQKFHIYTMNRADHIERVRQRMNLTDWNTSTDQHTVKTSATAA